mgnify:CR=1 FL=1
MKGDRGVPGPAGATGLEGPEGPKVCPRPLIKKKKTVKFSIKTFSFL